jgi:hypothetical protein
MDDFQRRRNALLCDRSCAPFRARYVGAGSPALNPEPSRPAPSGQKAAPNASKRVPPFLGARELSLSFWAQNHPKHALTAA